MSEERRRTMPMLRQHQDHSRHWRENFYVYPVISRRSGGLSIGVNLNPDTACNFDCLYCQVDRTGTPRVRDVDVEGLRVELANMIDLAASGRLFDDDAFKDVPEAWRCVKDIAFSGDGEPTTCPEFEACVRLAVELRDAKGLAETKIVLITDAAYLKRPAVVRALEIMDSGPAEIWAKLDAGTEAYFQRVNRPNCKLDHVVDNITAAAAHRPVVIQSLFMRLEGEPPPAEEIDAYIRRLHEIQNAGGRIDYVQVYTVARRPASAVVTALSDKEVDGITARVRDAGFRAEPFYGGATAQD